MATPRDFYHGTKADLKAGDLLVAGYTSNYGTGKPMSWIYFTGTLEAAIWAPNSRPARRESGSILSSPPANSSTIRT